MNNQENNIEGLKNFEGHIQVIVTKNQIAKAYLDTQQELQLEGNRIEETIKCPKRVIAMTNVIIEGLSSQGLAALWNTIHGFKHELQYEVGDHLCIAENNEIYSLYKVTSKNDVLGTYKVHKTFLDQSQQVQEMDIDMSPDAINKLSNCTIAIYNNTLLEWQGDDSAKYEDDERV